MQDIHLNTKVYPAVYETPKGSYFTIYFLPILAIVISFLGLMGLMALTILRRTKEIGIRKVNGATSRDIHFLFIRDSNRWILLALIIAIPSSYFALKKWLQAFACKTEMSWWVFIPAGLICI